MSGAATPSVAIVGGGLAGLAAAAALASANCRVELFEARRMLGGRATSFRDPATDQLVDQCQHVGMACCTNLADFCQRTGLDSAFKRERRLFFIGPDGKICTLEGSRWLPAPFHLATSFWRLGYLTAGERIGIAKAVWKLMRLPGSASPSEPTIGDWLRKQGQSERSIELFWSVILVSALGEQLDRASLSAARKVIVDGFVVSARAYEIDMPQAPLGQLYGENLERWFADRRVTVHLQSPVRQIGIDSGPCLMLTSGQVVRADMVVIALPWSKLAGVVDGTIAAAWSWLPAIQAVPGAPITAVHLWFDQPITPLPHAVLVGRLSQWVFRRPAPADAGHYYQVVISASRQLAGRDRQAIIDEVRADLAAVFPTAQSAHLRAARVVTESQAVFSALPGLDRVRPAQQTSLPGVIVAGDWTATGWPATMESAVRSGYLAAETVTAAAGCPQRFLAPDLEPGKLARWLIRQ